MSREISLALLTAATALVDAVSHDDNGSMVAGQWVGGNGGLLSRATIKTADELRLALNARARAPAEKSAGEGGAF